MKATTGRGKLSLLHNANWKDADGYPPVKGTSMHRWAVEFLSRNDEFRKAIDGLSVCAGPKNDPTSEYRRRWRDIADRFGIAFAMLPAWGGDACVRFKTTPYHLQSNVELRGTNGKFFLGADQGWGAALVFDLRKPIAPQIRAAERMLKGTRRSSASSLAGAQRDRRADYQAMLRVLDARAAEAKFPEIAKTLFPKKVGRSGIDYVKKLHKKAAMLRDGGYQHLPSLAVGRISTSA